MKIEKIDSDGKVIRPEVRGYPKLMYLKGNRSVIALFVKPEKGIRMSTPNEDFTSPGEYCETFLSEQFWEDCEPDEKYLISNE